MCQEKKKQQQKNLIGNGRVTSEHGQKGRKRVGLAKGGGVIKGMKSEDRLKQVGKARSERGDVGGKQGVVAD